MVHEDNYFAFNPKIDKSDYDNDKDDYIEKVTHKMFTSKDFEEEYTFKGVTTKMTLETAINKLAKELLENKGFKVKA